MACHATGKARPARNHSRRDSFAPPLRGDVGRTDRGFMRSGSLAGEFPRAIAVTVAPRRPAHRQKPGRLARAALRLLVGKLAIRPIIGSVQAILRGDEMSP